MWNLHTCEGNLSMLGIVWGWNGLCGLLWALLPEQQSYMVDDNSNEKDKGYGSRNVGSCYLLCAVTTSEIIQTKSSETKNVKVHYCLYNI